MPVVDPLLGIFREVDLVADVHLSDVDVARTDRRAIAEVAVADRWALVFTW
jgi:hypothetical protein